MCVYFLVIPCCTRHHLMSTILMFPLRFGVYPIYVWKQWCLRQMLWRPWGVTSLRHTGKICWSQVPDSSGFGVITMVHQLSTCSVGRPPHLCENLRGVFLVLGEMEPRGWRSNVLWGGLWGGWTSSCKAMRWCLPGFQLSYPFHSHVMEALWGGFASLRVKVILRTFKIWWTHVLYVWQVFSTPACAISTGKSQYNTSDDLLYLHSCSRVATAFARFSAGTSLSWDSSVGWRIVFLQDTSL